MGGNIISRIRDFCDDSAHPRSVIVEGTSYKIRRVVGEGGFGFVYAAVACSEIFPCIHANEGDQPGVGEEESIVQGGSPGDGLLAKANRGASYEQGREEGRHAPALPSNNITSASGINQAGALNREPLVALKRYIVSDSGDKDKALGEVILHERLCLPLSPAPMASNAVEAQSLLSFIMANHVGYQHIVSLYSYTVNNSRGGLYRAFFQRRLSSQGANKRKNPEVWAVMDYCSGGTLRDAVDRKIAEGTYFTGRQVLVLMMQATAAVQHLHLQSPPITHNDIKLENYLIDFFALPSPQTGHSSSRLGFSSGGGEHAVSFDDAQQYQINNADRESVLSISSENNIRSRGNSYFSLSSIFTAARRSLSSFGSNNQVNAPTSGGRTGNHPPTLALKLKLCDFGSAMSYSYPAEQRSRQQSAEIESDINERVTLAYRAPETIDPFGSGRARIDAQCDIWALGVMLYILLFQEHPFPDDSPQAILIGRPRRTEPLQLWRREVTATPNHPSPAEGTDAGRAITLEIKGELLKICLDRLLVKDPAKRANVHELAFLLVKLAAQAGITNHWLYLNEKANYERNEDICKLLETDDFWKLLPNPGTLQPSKFDASINNNDSNNSNHSNNTAVKLPNRVAETLCRLPCIGSKSLFPGMARMFHRGSAARLAPLMGASRASLAYPRFFENNLVVKMVGRRCATAAEADTVRYAVTLDEIRAHSKNAAVAYWMYFCGLVVAGVVVVGGITRLTESGLSIVDWRPITGVIPPISAEDWEAEFNKYKQFPEFKQNPDMTMDEFKFIFYWEWGHRMLARSLGFFYGIPMVYFFTRGRFRHQPLMKAMVLSLLALGGAQGAMGWYMVKSGLDSRLLDERKKAMVSAYRLAAHLTLAFLIYAGMMRTGFGLRLPAAADFPGKAPVQALARLSFAVMFTTAVSGAFVAGLRAGFLYTDGFPWMGEGIFPPWEDLFHKDLPWYRNLFENGVCAQTWHRMMAGTTTSLIICLNFAVYAASRRMPLPPPVQRAVMAVNAALLLQVSLGIMTIMTAVHLHTAASHQAGSIILLTTLIRLCAVLGSRGVMLP